MNAPSELLQQDVGRAVRIPITTQERLLNPSPPGGRHAQMVQIATSLTASGLTPEAIYVQLRSMYAADVSDKEIRDVVQWADEKGCVAGVNRQATVLSAARQRRSKLDPDKAIQKLLQGFSCAESDLYEASPRRPSDDWRNDALEFLATMYHPGDLINIVTEYRVDEKNIKATPMGRGRTLERDAWVEEIRSYGTPQSKAGAWIRMNPVDGQGIADANVTAFRYALVEFDNIPLDQQLSLLAKLPLPINAILTSGGASCHGWVRIDACDADSYRRNASELLALLEPFGADKANKNPSRLSRLAGAERTIGASADGQQRLLYLAPDRTDCNPILKE